MLFVQNRGGNYKSLSFFLLQSKNVVEFDLLPLEWVLHSSVRGNLLGWHDSFMVRNRRKYGGLALVVDYLEGKEQKSFVNWARAYIEDHTLFMLDFEDWLSS